MSDLQAVARKIYDACGHNHQKLYTSDELLPFVPSRDQLELVTIINELLGRGYIRTLKQGDAYVYKFVSKDEVDRYVPSQTSTTSHRTENID